MSRAAALICPALLIVPALLALPACNACDADVIVPRDPPTILLNTDQIDFGAVPVGQRVFRRLTVLNEGDEPLALEGFTLEPAGAFYAELTALEIIGARDEEILVSFLPLEPRTYSATLTITSNAENRPQAQVTLVGQGVESSVCGACDAPPAPTCVTPDHSQIYDDNGRCEDDECRYDALVFPCQSGCDDTTGLCADTDVCDFIDCTDGGVADAGYDAGADAGPQDAGHDAGVVDGGYDAGGCRSPCTIDLEVRCTPDDPFFAAELDVHMNDADYGYVTVTLPGQAPGLSYCAHDIVGMPVSAEQGTILVEYEIGTCLVVDCDPPSSCDATIDYDCQ
jgi:hypothetical protein